MTIAPGQRDLICLVADKDIEAALVGLLARPAALHMSPIEFDAFTHPERDPGCFQRSHDFLRPYSNRYRHGLVIFDKEGCGRDQFSTEAVEADLEERLSANGWDDRAAAIAIDPEVEIWVWSQSPIVDEVLGWEQRQPVLREWLVERDFVAVPDQKPQEPKQAFRGALRAVGKARSSSIFRELGARVGLQGCQDQAFLKLQSSLAGWFPA